MDARLFRLRRCAAAAAALVLAVAGQARGPAARAAVSTPYDSERRTQIAPGVFHDRGTIETTTAGRQAVHVVEVDAAQPALRLEAMLSNDEVAGLEPASTMANRRNGEGHRAVAAINGDFWGARQEPGGLHVQDGELMVSGPDARPTLGVTPAGGCLIGSPRVTGTATRPDGTQFAITAVNQPRAAGRLVLYTRRFASSTGTDSAGTEVVLTGLALPLATTGSYEGTVSLVRPSAGNTPIAAGEVVLSGSGAAASFLAVLAPGARVNLALAITPGWEDVRQAVGGGQYIVRAGAVSVEPWSPGFADVTHPRTAAACTAGGDFVLVTVDGRQPGYSIGVRLDELGELLRDRGALTAINLDGGGSTTMSVRLPGEDGLTTVNRGSDGFERAVSNGFGVFSTAPTGPLAILNVFPEDAHALVGARVAYTARGQDASFNAVAVAPAEVAWSASGAGVIDAAGLFTASTAGEGSVSASARGVSGSTHVVVHDSLSVLEVSPNPAVVPPGGTQAFSLLGRDAEGAPVRVDPPLASWTVNGPVGTIDTSGVLTASTGGSGSVEAAAGGATGSARVDVGRPPVVLEDFEDISDMRAASARASATLTPAMRPLPVRNGTRSGRLGYDFTTGPAGTSAAYAAHSPFRPIDARPLAIGVWVYGDGSRHWVRGNFRDGTGAPKVVDFTAAPGPAPASRADCLRRTGGIDWVGWKYLETPIPDDTVLPMSWERVYVVEVSDLCDDVSAVYLDDLRAVYSDTGEDLAGPEVSELLPAPGSTVHSPQPVIGGTVRDGASAGVAPESIRLTVDGAQVPAHFDPVTGVVRYTPEAPLGDGVHRATLEATDRAGNPALPFGDWTFIIYTGPDLDPPMVDRAQPLDGTVSFASRPRVSARIRDLYRGVDPASIEMKVDGAAVSAMWDAAADVVWWAPATALADGEHVVSLDVADGESPPNRAELSWSFTVRALPPPSGAFRFTWIADGGYFEGTGETAATLILGEHLARERSAPPALLVFGGDLVENDQQVNYDRAVAALDTVSAPRLVAAGNHEISGTLSRDRFWRTFGPTIAAVDFGPAVFLVLDSASSSLSYDASQFAWIESELARPGAGTVFVVLHVPTRDPFSSGHGLPAVDGLHLEAILAAARAARPERDIVVLSGDAHAHARWTSGGVTYLISGGGGGSPDAAPTAGGFYHRLHVEVDASGRAAIRVVPPFEAIAIEPPAARLLGGERLPLNASGDVFTAGAPDMTIPVADPVDRAWSSSAPSVVVVDAEGVVEGWVPGTANVRVTSGGVTAEAQVRVEATLASLRVLTDRAFTEGGITHHGIHGALIAKLEEAEAGAPEALQGYIHLLRAQRGKKVTEAWADRLIANAEYVRANR
jgi:hypothetical protein